MLLRKQDRSTPQIYISAESHWSLLLLKQTVDSSPDIVMHRRWNLISHCRPNVLVMAVEGMIMKYQSTVHSLLQQQLSKLSPAHTDFFKKIGEWELVPQRYMSASCCLLLLIRHIMLWWTAQFHGLEMRVEDKCVRPLFRRPCCVWSDLGVWPDKLLLNFAACFRSERTLWASNSAALPLVHDVTVEVVYSSLCLRVVPVFSHF